MGNDRAKAFLWGSSCKVQIVKSGRVKRIGLGDPEIMQREQHLEGLSFRFVEGAIVFVSVRSR